MNFYRVVPEGSAAYTVTARSIAHVVAFTRHWRSVRVKRIRVL